MTSSSVGFYITGGTLPRDAPSYIERQADADLLEGLRQGQFCYVLTSRQMGKSSLMVRTAARLREEGVAVAVLDLTAVGQNLTPEQWYDGLLNLLASALELEDELQDFWFENERLGPLQRWMEGLRSVVLPAIKTEGEKGRRGEGEEKASPLPTNLGGRGDEGGRLVIFIDEIDAVRSLPFSADEFFAAIRECYNRRTEDPDYARLTFCLLGVASPSDLIRDTRNTPFNIGRRIDLTDFTLEEALPLAAGLEGEKGRRGEGEKKASTSVHNLPLSTVSDASGGSENDTFNTSSPLLPFSPSASVTGSGQTLLTRVLYWTGGHPYLTQRLCQAVSEQVIQTPSSKIENRKSKIENSEVDRVCEERFLSASAQERDDNLIFVRERLLRSEADLAGLLELYGQVSHGKPVRDDETQPLVSVLKLAGVVRAEGGLLAVRNRIYERVFDRIWIAENMPDAELRRQRAAYRRGVLRATSVAAVMLGLLAALIATFAMSRRALQDAADARQVAALREAAQVKSEQALKEKEKASVLARRSADQARQAEQRERSLRRKAEAASRRAAEQQRIARTQAAEANRQRGRAERLKRLMQQQSYFDAARALRASGQMGQRFACLDALAHAAAMHPAPEMRLQLRNEAISAMALPVDLRVRKRWSGLPLAHVIAVDPDHGRYFRSDPRGNIRILRIADDHLIRTLPGYGLPVAFTNRRSPDGRYLVSAYSDGTVILWDCLMGKPVLRMPGGTFIGDKSLDLSPDSRWAAAAFADNSIRILDLPAGRERRRFHSVPQPDRLRLSPDGRRLAIASYNQAHVHVLDLSSGSDFDIPTPAAAHDVAWHPDGRRLAVASTDRHIYVVDVEAHRVALDLEGHLNEPTQISFNSQGTLLASSGWDNTVRLWNPESGQHLLVNPVEASNTLEFSRDGRRLIGVGVMKSWIWEVAGGQECRLLGAPRRNEWTNRPEFSPDGRLLVAADPEGAHLWHVSQARLLASLPLEGCRGAEFRPKGTGLITSGPDQLALWPITRDGLTGALKIGPPRSLADWKPAGGEQFCQSLDGRVIAVVHHANQAHLLYTDRPRQVVLSPQDRMIFIATSPDGRWVATSPWEDNGQVKIWDARTARLARDLPISTLTLLAFSPDGRWLVGGTEEYRFWQTGTWRPGRSIARAPGSACPAPMDFTRDGRMLALAGTSTLVRLVDPATGREFASLQAHDQTPLSWLRFSPDGARLASIGGDGAIRLWDLRRIRQKLAAMGLDWDLPPYPPADTMADARTLSAEVIGGEATSPQYQLPKSLYPHAVEAESLALLDAQNGEAGHQPMGQFGSGWSGNEQFFFRGLKPGAEATLELPIAATGTYLLSVYYTTAPDYGIVQVLLDGKEIGAPTDCYTPHVLPKGKTDLGTLALSDGLHRITFRVIGKNLASAGYLVGVDAIGVENSGQ